MTDGKRRKVATNIENPLPPEMSLSILRHLSLSDKKSCRLVNQKFRDIIDEELLVQCVRYSSGEEPLIIDAAKQTIRLLVEAHPKAERITIKLGGHNGWIDPADLGIIELPPRIKSLKFSARLLRQRIWSDHIVDIHIKLESNAFSHISPDAFRHLRSLNIRQDYVYDLDLSEAIHLERLTLLCEDINDCESILNRIPHPEKMTFLNIELEFAPDVPSNIIGRFPNLTNLTLFNLWTMTSLHHLESLDFSFEENLAKDAISTLCGQSPIFKLKLNLKNAGEIGRKLAEIPSGINSLRLSVLYDEPLESNFQSLQGNFPQLERLQLEGLGGFPLQTFSQLPTIHRIFVTPNYVPNLGNFVPTNCQHVTILRNDGIPWTAPIPGIST
eukprot:TRINITY_DN1213_c3_g1_i4.p1 TRINITY_DN1213_c3_g1~~TRINITY_DN1213_c3_g1_i4.p1  ORF type:complete len:385 (+),score=108.80 TRINITY_DN1213_c3_g1_i4:168-1322(+)